MIKNYNSTHTLLNKRIAYDTKTKSGTDAVMQQQWEIIIQKELDKLKEFSNLKK